MGNQILGLAAGMDVYRMQFGNRGHNQPVLALANSGSIKSGRVYITVRPLPAWSMSDSSLFLVKDVMILTIVRRLFVVTVPEPPVRCRVD